VHLVLLADERPAGGATGEDRAMVAVGGADVKR